MTKVAAVQMASTNDVQNNIDMACKAIALAASGGAKLVVLPEEFATLGLTGAQKQALSEEFGNGPLQQRLQLAAQQNKIWIVAGTLWIKNQSHKPNACTLVYNDEGQCIARYDKIHLFDVNVQDKEEYRESDNIAPGEHIVVVQTPFGKIGLAICYDIRFPELFRAMMFKGAQIVVLPSAFTIPTGKAHWEILLRARAIENLCYIIAPGECGLRSDGRGTFGHSMIISPWGEILSSLQAAPGLVSANIDLDKMQTLRNNFPALNHIQSFVIKEFAKEVSQ
ncbi:MAG: carbon-nitrogen hydrolase family protein [Proteobacteria bacterium]|nr:carbon-nitrogen hydrolase family protein [Pseudomonadota bacterium]